MFAGRQAPAPLKVVASPDDSGWQQVPRALHCELVVHRAAQPVTPSVVRQTSSALHAHAFAPELPLPQPAPRPAPAVTIAAARIVAGRSERRLTSPSMPSPGFVGDAK
jgi:hypothetical protein